MPLLLVSNTSASLLDILRRANHLCPAVADAVETITSTVSIVVPGPTTTVTIVGAAGNDAVPVPTLPLPMSTGTCMTDAQANNVVAAWKSILTSTDRNAAAKTAGTVIAEEFLIDSDSMNSIDGTAVS
jgi:hypothetical protein